MKELFDKEGVASLLRDKTIMLLGGSVIRGLYKDLVWLQVYSTWAFWAWPGDSCACSPSCTPPTPHAPWTSSPQGHVWACCPQCLSVEVGHHLEDSVVVVPVKSNSCTNVQSWIRIQSGKVEAVFIFNILSVKFLFPDKPHLCPLGSSLANSDNWILMFLILRLSTDSSNNLQFVGLGSSSLSSLVSAVFLWTTWHQDGPHS